MARWFWVCGLPVWQGYDLRVRASALGRQHLMLCVRAVCLFGWTTTDVCETCNDETCVTACVYSVVECLS